MADPMGIMARSSSSTATTRTPSPASRASRRRSSSALLTGGLATSEVSSTKMRVGENGMAYRKDGSSSLRARPAASRWPSLQSMSSAWCIGHGHVPASISRKAPYVTW